MESFASRHNSIHSIWSLLREMTMRHSRSRLGVRCELHKFRPIAICAVATTPMSTQVRQLSATACKHFVGLWNSFRAHTQCATTRHRQTPTLFSSSRHANLELIQCTMCADKRNPSICRRDIYATDKLAHNTRASKWVLDISQTMHTCALSLQFCRFDQSQYVQHLCILLYINLLYIIYCGHSPNYMFAAGATGVKSYVRSRSSI